MTEGKNWKRSLYERCFPLFCIVFYLSVAVNFVANIFVKAWYALIGGALVSALCGAIFYFVAGHDLRGAIIFASGVSLGLLIWLITMYSQWFCCRMGDGFACLR